MLVEVVDLKVHFPIRRGLLRRVVGHVKAVDGVSLEIREGRTLALVGESGSGKTTAGKAILQLIRPTAGSVRAGGTELGRLSRAALRPLRRKVQIVFQDPYSSLNPRMRVGQIVEEPLIIHRLGDARAGQLHAVALRVLHRARQHVLRPVGRGDLEAILGQGH